jgi:enediyne biosynthesis protein E4
MSQRPRLRGVPRAAMVAAALLMIQLGVIRPAIAADVDIRLSFVGEIRSVAQGQPFPFRVMAKNKAPSTQSITVLFLLTDPSSTVKDIRKWVTTVPPGATVTIKISEAAAQWFEATGTFTVSATLNGAAAGNTLSYTVTAPTVAVPQFEDVTGDMGLSSVLGSDLNRNHSAGAAWADVNGDGHLDLYVPLREQPSQLWIYQTGTGTYEEQAAVWNATNPGGQGVSAVFADYDNDGDPDLYVVNDAIDPRTAQPTGQGNRLYRNEFVQGQQIFTDVSASAGVQTQGNGASASWGDYDGDSYLDLYTVTNDAYNNDGGPGPRITYYQPDHLFHNEGDGTFTDVTCQTLPTNDSTSGFCPDPAMGGSTGSGFQAVWLDYDRDGDQDLYLVQDYFAPLPHKDINRMYRNDGFDPFAGHWKFTEVCAAQPNRAECLEIHSMGIAVGDVNGDLWPDIAISNGGGAGGNVLLQNNRDGTFKNVSQASGIPRIYQEAGVTSVTWGLGFYDFNLDGLQDLYVAAGSTGDRLDQPNELFAGTPTAQFLDLSAPSNAADPGVGHGVAFADYDRDGLVDLYVVNSAGSPILYRNVTSTTGRWLEVRLAGTTSNRDGCGARAVLTSDGVERAAWVICGTSLGTGSDTVLHFGGLGSGQFTLAIEWPSGIHQTVTDTGTNRLLTVTEP